MHQPSLEIWLYGSNGSVADPLANSSLMSGLESQTDVPRSDFADFQADVRPSQERMFRMRKSFHSTGSIRPTADKSMATNYVVLVVRQITALAESRAGGSDVNRIPAVI